MEIRALELRLEDAEAASRESRDAVLTQLERLSSRIEWRIRRLEPEPPPSPDEPRPIGVHPVPIRGSEP